MVEVTKINEYRFTCDYCHRVDTAEAGDCNDEILVHNKRSARVYLGYHNYNNTLLLCDDCLRRTKRQQRQRRKLNHQ